MLAIYSISDLFDDHVSGFAVSCHYNPSLNPRHCFDHSAGLELRMIFKVLVEKGVCIPDR